MLKIGITGQKGFVGTHLYNTLGLQPEKFERIPFERSFFDNENVLDAFVNQCDVIVHAIVPYTLTFLVGMRYEV